MAEALSALRSLMARHSPPLDALVVPSEDYHQSESVSARDKRRQFVSGFTGGAGLALVTKDGARLWTDWRYLSQAKKELSDEWTLMSIGEDPAVEIWIADNLPEKAAIGVDPWCVSIDAVQRWERAFVKKQQQLVQTSKNLVDEVWKDRPPAEVNPVIIQPIEFAGRSVADKLKDLREKLITARGIIITALDEVCWLYNVRGSDLTYWPAVHAFAIVTLGAAFFYVDKKKLSPEYILQVNSYLKENGIEARDYDAIGSDVSLLASSNQLSKPEPAVGTTVNGSEGDLLWMDPVSVCYALYSKLNSDGQVLLQQSPLALSKALKNPVELVGLKNCHIRDGAAVVQFHVWLDKQMQELYGAPGYFSEAETVMKRPCGEAHRLTEVTVSDKLSEFRATKEHFRGLSFPTISCVGANAATFTYNAHPETCAEMDPHSIYLVDSGGQYRDGTTDITRTLHFGRPSAHEKACYTAVLKGHISLGLARFPNGTNGHALDILARLPLWKLGLDYGHATGHGIGSYLNVPQGPHLISFKPQARDVPLKASMTVTDEPAYYEDGKFGIILENLLIIKEADTEFNFAEKGYLEFEHITWAPYQRKLMDLSLLSSEEINWVNTYHSKCREVLAPFLNETEMTWLRQATEPIYG